MEIRCGVEVGKDVTIPQLREQGYLAFYVAIGCQGGRLPGVPGETAKGTDIAVHFLHEALADETQRMEGSVVVVGGGNVAIDCARTAVRFGADAGAGEIIVLHPRGGLVHHPDTLVIPLLVPDAPVVAWWPNEAPANPSKDLLGAMARSRITDAMHSSNPYRTIEDLRRNWSPKNVDMAWTRLTVWRAMLATMLDQPPHLPISTVKVSGPKGFLPMDLLAAWLRLKLNVPVIMEEVPGATAVTGVYLTRADGTLSLERPDAKEGIAVISTPGQSPQSISVPTRTLEECLSEELRQLDPDEVYAEVITQGWNLIHPAE